MAVLVITFPTFVLLPQNVALYLLIYLHSNKSKVDFSLFLAFILNISDFLLSLYFKYYSKNIATHIKSYFLSPLIKEACLLTKQIITEKKNAGLPSTVLVDTTPTHKPERSLQKRAKDGKKC